MVIAGIDAGFFEAVATMATRVEADPFDLLDVAGNESGVYAGDYNAVRDRTAHNPDGHASGLWQLMPDTARGLGWDAGDCNGKGGHTPLWHFRRLSATQQVPWFERYFSAYHGRLVSLAAIYCSVFLPADIALAADPDALLVARGGRRGWAFASNASFDENHDQRIQVYELTDAVQRNARGPRFDAIRAGMREVLGLEPVPFTELPTDDLRTTAGLQAALAKFGYYRSQVDGIPGPLTTEAVREFQRDKGLVIDGIPGPLTQAAIAAV